MALISEWMQQCEKKVLDDAGIVRDACFRQLWPISPNSQAVLNLVDTVLDREHTLALDVAAVYEASQLSFCRAGPKVLGNLARQFGYS